MAILKALKYKPCLSFQACEKKLWNLLTQLTIYLPTKIGKKVANI